jgi:ATP-binding cassette subfamily B protein
VTALIGRRAIELLSALRPRHAPRERGPWWTWLPLLRQALRYARPFGHLIVASLVMIGLTSLLSLLAPWPLAILVDSVLGAKPLPSILPNALGSLDKTWLLVALVVGGLLLTALENGITVLNEYVTTRLDQWMVLDLRSDLFRHVHRLSPSFYEGKQTGTLMYQINGLAGAVGAVVVALPPVLQSIVTLGGMFYVAYRIDPTLALLSLTVVPVIYVSLGYYSRRVEPRLVNARRLEGQSLSIVHEAISMLKVIVTFGREAHAYDRFREQGETAVRARVGVTVRQTVFSLVVNTTTAVGSALVLGVGAWHVLQHEISVGELLVLIGYIAAIYKPLEQLSGTVSSLQEQFVALRSVFRLLAEPPEIQDATDAADVERVSGLVTFEGVRFAYPGRSETIASASFTVEAGSRVAIVGPTGAGKTTLVWLLARFYDPDEGRILLDQLDLRRIRLHSLRRQMSIVLQEPLLFTGSIADNIRYGRLEATDDEVVTAAEAANAHEFIRSLPSGYGTVLGERGARLSGGERQRVSIARAFLKDAPILILDEPTSSIDSRTESIILDALDRLSEGRTTFVIAHRLSTINRADRILVMDRGRLVESGTHPELLAHDGLYRQLWDVQTGGRTGGRTDPWSEAQHDATSAVQALVQAVRLLLDAGPADLAVLASAESEPESIRAAASTLAQLTPEQLDLLRDLDDAGLARLLGEAVRPEEFLEAAL